MIPMPKPQRTRPAYIMARLGACAATCRMPPRSSKLPAKLSTRRRPICFVRNGGNAAPKKAPPLNTATMFEDRDAYFVASAAKLKSSLKLFWNQ